MDRAAIEAFRVNGKKLIDEICDYFILKSAVQPNYLAPLLPASAPEDPEPYDAIMADVHTKIMPGMTHWQHPHFYAYYPSSTSFPAIMGDMLSSMFNVVGFNWICSPAMTELETVTLDWMAKLLGLPECFHSHGMGGGSIQGSASEAVVVVMIASRTNFIERDGKDVAPKLIAYASDQAHSATKKAAIIANVEFATVASDDAFCMQADALEARIVADITKGLVPFFVTATVGTTSSCAVDNVPEIVKVCKKYGIWLHIDAAYAGVTMICPEYQHFGNGIEGADSFNTNCSKFFMIPFDCSLLWVQRRKDIIKALSVTPEYLKTKEYESGFVTDYRDWQLPLGRRFRSLKLWFVLKHYGATGMRAYIRHHMELSKLFLSLIQQDERFQVAAPPALALVCFRLRGQPNDVNKRLNELINERGLFLSHTDLKGHYVLRIVHGSPLSREEHIHHAWKVIQEAANELC